MRRRRDRAQDAAGAVDGDQARSPAASGGAPVDVAELVRPALVPVQLLAVVALLWPGHHGRLPPWVRAGGLASTAAGGVLAVTAAARMGRDLTPVVDPRQGARLQTGGVFALSRHPIYTGLLVGAAGWTAWRGRREPLVAAVVLAVVLHLKAGLEERRLHARFGSEYQAYVLRTPRLLRLPRPLGRVRPPGARGATADWRRPAST